MAQQSKDISLKHVNLPQTFCGANTDIGTIHNRVDHFYDAMRLQAISVKEKKHMYEGFRLEFQNSDLLTLDNENTLVFLSSG